VIGGVGNSLDTAIGKVYLVRSRDSFAISDFGSLEVSSRVFISYSVLESVWFWGFIIYLWFAVSWSWGVIWSRGWVIRSWGSSWEGSSTGYKSTYNGKTEHGE
jgi:hypothetical protein